MFQRESAKAIRASAEVDLVQHATNLKSELLLHLAIARAQLGNLADVEFRWSHCCLGWCRVNRFLVLVGVSGDSLFAVSFGCFVEAGVLRAVSGHQHAAGWTTLNNSWCYYIVPVRG